MNVNTSPDLDSTEQSRDRTSSSESGWDSEDDKETFSNESHETSSTESTAGSESSEIPDGEWEVEEIVDFVRDDFGEHYHVKWKDWDADENTWETRKNLRNCETELLRFYRKRKEEARQALACTEYVELPNGKRRKKVGVRSVPLDPRPFDVRVQEFYDVSGKLAEEDILLEDKIVVGFQKAFQECTNKSLSDKPRWPLEKVNKFIEDGADGKLSNEDVKALKDQLILIEVDSRNTSLSTDIEKWEKHINSVTGGRPKITIVNEVDTSGPPIGFEFRNEYVAGDGVSIPTDPPLGCDCGNDPTSCYDGRSKCCAVKSGCKFAYTKSKKVKVRQGNPIYECNSKCKCGPECANRVVQDGKSDHKLCIFRTSNGCGWGVKSLKSIKKGTFVTLYVGEVIKSDEAERRGKDYDEVGCTYLFDLDFNDTDNFPYSVDASKYGNVAHFINHSCSPNLGVYAVWVDCLDVNLPKLAMFALTDIRKNEELTFDYDLQLSESKSQSEEENEKEKVEKETPARKKTKSGVVMEYFGVHLMNKLPRTHLYFLLNWRTPDPFEVESLPVSITGSSLGVQAEELPLSLIRGLLVPGTGSFSADCLKCHDLLRGAVVDSASS
ncbi:Histone-lysine N-methyltransferase SUV39H2 [Orchesella cincta]|uniref:Histone-lysine N-methyltransferase SUV39H2 n=1 Tax=Orchesella cincta TaxID=48709 RepID=A0A1D2M5G9_ORCCI|nr:Histone-lysine N-methyltransferase SUV39H2 [Orchesella cincta]